MSSTRAEPSCELWTLDASSVLTCIHQLNKCLAVLVLIMGRLCLGGDGESVENLCVSHSILLCT